MYIHRSQLHVILALRDSTLTVMPERFSYLKVHLDILQSAEMLPTSLEEGILRDRQQTVITNIHTRVHC
jgi:hypothetical protein